MSAASAVIDLPAVVYSEEVMREGFNIEAVSIALHARVQLPKALSDTGPYFQAL